MKIKNEVMGRRFHQSLAEIKEKNIFVKTLKNENHTLIVCSLKMLKIFQKQNQGVIDKEFDQVVKKYFL